MTKHEQFGQTVRIRIPAETDAVAQAAVTPKTAAPVSVLPRAGIRTKLVASEYLLYHEFLENIYDAVLIADWEGHILDGNTRAIEFFKYDSHELQTRSVFDIIYGFDLAILQQICANLDADQFTLIEEAYCWRKDRSLFPAEIATNKLHLGDEKHLCFFIRDITKRKQAEKLLQQARDQLDRAERLEMIGSIAGQIAHDFNNLLTPLVAYPDFVRSKLSKNSEACADLDVIATTAQQMADINQQLMALSRRAYHEPSVLNMNDVLETHVAFLSRNKLLNGIKIEQDLATDLLNIKGSPQQLLRVIQNLCQNGIEAMGAAGTLTLKTGNVYIDEPVQKSEVIERGEYVKVSIADTGSGIPIEIRDKIFDPFFTTRQSAKQRGSGLGLSVVRGIVKDHKGFIDVESMVGKESTFSLYLPSCHEEIATEAPARSYRGTGTIMIVDDDKLQIEVMTRLLQNIGYTVETAASGEEALQLFAAYKKTGRFPKLLILDMVMGPGMDGAQTYQELKAINPQQKAIILSGYAESPRVDLARKLGAGAFVRKPVTLAKLSKAVYEELARK